MRHTEKEAKTKWCPFSRAYDGTDNGGAVATNRPLAYAESYGGKRETILCIGSRCMAWRWSDEEPGDADYGYCGLAGKP